MTTTVGILSFLVVVTCVNAWLLASVAARARKLERVNERLDGFGNALELLADATESGFGDLAAEFGKMTATIPAAVRRGTRAAAAPKRARTLAEPAVANEMSEGEAGLRKRLADARRRPAEEDGKGGRARSSRRSTGHSSKREEKACLAEHTSR